MERVNRNSDGRKCRLSKEFNSLIKIYFTKINILCFYLVVIKPITVLAILYYPSSMLHRVRHLHSFMARKSSEMSDRVLYL